MATPVSGYNQLISYDQGSREPSLRISSTALRKDQSVYIPANSPPYDEVVAHSLELGLQPYLRSEEYCSNLKLILPDVNDWTQLCNFDDFIGDNIKNIDKETHKTTCRKLFSHDSRLYCWLYDTAAQEPEKHSELSAQYKSLSLDWSRSYYRKSHLSEIPNKSFNWRKLVSPESMALMLQQQVRKHKMPSISSCGTDQPRKKPKLSHPVKARSDQLQHNDCCAQTKKIRLAMESSVRVSILKKTLDGIVDDIETYTKKQDSDYVIGFKDNYHSLVSRLESSAKGMSLENQGETLIIEATNLMRSDEI